MQNRKHSVREIARRISRSIYHFGIDLHEDIRRCLPNEHLKTIFDVGANEGQSARKFLEHYPSATIRCFEPNPDCCEILQAVDSRLIIVKLAVGDKIGVKGFDRSQGGSDMFRLTGDMSGEIVTVDTLDHFCETNAVKQIDLLKIDTEGHDLEVLRGGAGLLKDNRINILQAEVSMNVDNKYHTPFSEAHAHMEHFGYRLFAIHEQVNEWPAHEPHMRRANVCYISAAVIARNKGANLRQ